MCTYVRVFCHTLDRYNETNASMATLRHPATTLIRYDVGKSNNLSSRICVLINHRTTMRSCTILIFFVLTMFCRKCSSLLRLPGFSAKTQLNRMVSLRMASTDFSADLQSMKGDLINLMTSTARGSNENNRMEISRLIDSFVAAKSDVSNPIRTQDLEGEWELLYTDDDITR